MTQLFAQGDILLELVPDIEPSGVPVTAGADGATVLAEGEATGHRHVIREQVLMFRDDALARGIPDDLYVGHVNVPSSARVVHDEHRAIELPKGTYRVRRQRQLDPLGARRVAD